MKKYYYTYRITNTEENKHYYGMRGTNAQPINDLGVTYFSSSSDKEFIELQLSNPAIFKYKVIRAYTDKEKAIALEVKLHSKLDVGLNKAFYNKAKQTSTKFSIEGNTEVIEKMKATRNAELWKCTTGAEKTKRRHTTMIGNDQYKINGLKISKVLNTIQGSGMTLAQEIGKKVSNTINKDIIVEGTLTTIAKETGKKAKISNSKVKPCGKTGYQIATDKMVETRSSKNENGLSSFEEAGLKTKERLNTIEDNGKSYIQNQIDRTMSKVMPDGRTYKEHAADRSKEFMKSNNPAAKVFAIYDSKGVVVWQGKGKLKDICNERGYPLVSLRGTLKTGIPLYINIIRPSVIAKLKNNGNWQYKGWYLKEIICTTELRI